MSEDSLWRRAESAISESRRLTVARQNIFDLMTDIAHHRLILARDMRRWVQAAEQDAVATSTRAIRAGCGPDEA